MIGKWSPSSDQGHYGLAAGSETAKALKRDKCEE